MTGLCFANLLSRAEYHHGVEASLLIRDVLISAVLAGVT